MKKWHCTDSSSQLPYKLFCFKNKIKGTPNFIEHIEYFQLKRKYERLMHNLDCISKIVNYKIKSFSKGTNNEKDVILHIINCSSLQAKDKCHTCYSKDNNLRSLQVALQKNHEIDLPILYVAYQ